MRDLNEGVTCIINWLMQPTYPVDSIHYSFTSLLNLRWHPWPLVHFNHSSSPLVANFYRKCQYFVKQFLTWLRAKVSLILVENSMSSNAIYKTNSLLPHAYIPQARACLPVDVIRLLDPGVRKWRLEPRTPALCLHWVKVLILKYKYNGNGKNTDNDKYKDKDKLASGAQNPSIVSPSGKNPRPQIQIQRLYKSNSCQES